MNRAVLYFSDNSTLELKEDDFITPIVRTEFDGESFSSMAQAVKLITHIHNGLIPSILDAFTQSNFFYINRDYKSVYNSNAIVKIELI